MAAAISPSKGIRGPLERVARAAEPDAGDPSASQLPAWVSEISAQIPRPISASERAQYVQWMTRRAAELRDAPCSRPADFPGPKTVIDDARDGDVDWISFFAAQIEPWDFPQMMVVNHSWFVWKDWFQREAGLPAEPVLPGGGVPNSAFFVNVDVSSYTPEFLRAENEQIRPQGKISFTRAKTGGTAEGFFGKDQRGVEYIFVFDPPFNPEMVTAAEHIGSTLARVAGYHVPKTAVCRIQGTGNAAYDGRRAVATVALEGFKTGWTYRANRRRRELRGLRVLAAWLHNVDQTSHNTAHSVNDTGIAQKFVFDFGASLGSFTYRPKWPRLGDHYLFAPTDSLFGVLTGLEWGRPYAIHSPAVGHFPEKVDPRRWRPFYRNFAFESATWEDNVWGAQLLAQFSDEQIRTVVAQARYSHPSDAQYVADTLIKRRDQLVAYYLKGLAPAGVRERLASRDSH